MKNLNCSSDPCRNIPDSVHLFFFFFFFFFFNEFGYFFFFFFFFFFLKNWGIFYLESERKGRFVSKDWLSLFLTLGWWGGGRRGFVSCLCNNKIYLIPCNILIIIPPPHLMPWIFYSSSLLYSVLILIPSPSSLKAIWSFPIKKNHLPLPLPLAPPPTW